MADKLGPYINKLMTTIIDGEVEEFVKELAFSELRKLNTDIESFVRKNEQDDSNEVEKTVKQLLQEDIEDESN